MNFLTAGLLLFIFGLTLFLLILFTYTEDAHQKEIKKYKWVRNDLYASWAEQDVILFHKIASKSFVPAKVIILILAFFPLAFGVFALWIYFRT
ncbi:hypothetical protein V1498_12160 [Peribacillus sp. SCS-26]|uniref:hypothetical protein n=1 Tax=Paraperibacillus marinus TaxID=3115295 RepID=UPI0039062835